MTFVEDEVMETELRLFDSIDVEGCRVDVKRKGRENTLSMLTC